MAFVVLDKLSMTYRNERREPVPALRHVTLSVERGEFLVILGPSGCGKTTMLRLVAGLEKPDAGSIHIDGRDVLDVEPHERDVAMVFQQPALYPHLSAFENMALGLKLRKCPTASIGERVRSTAERLGLAALLDRFPAELSGGERQRVSIGRALVREPKVLLLDEPFSNLDSALRRDLRSSLASIHRQLGTTMFFVTHDTAEAELLAHRILLLNGGEIQQLADPETLSAHPANRFVEEFFARDRR